MNGGSSQAFIDSPDGNGNRATWPGDGDFSVKCPRRIVSPNSFVERTLPSEPGSHSSKLLQNACKGLHIARIFRIVFPVRPKPLSDPTSANRWSRQPS